MSGDLVGRGVESGAAAAALDTLDSGPLALVIEGEPGIGKTTMWRGDRRDGDGTRRAGVDRPTGRIRGAAGVRDPGGPARWRPRDRLRRPARAAAAGAGRRPAPCRAGRHRHRRPGGVRRDGDAPARAGGGRARSSSPSTTCSGWIRPRGPTLAFTARRLGESPVGFIVASRPDRDASALGLEEALPGDRFVRVRLGPLSAGALYHLFTAQLGRAFPRATMIRIAEASGGNPFYALEIGRALVERRRVAGGRPHARPGVGPRSGRRPDPAPARTRPRGAAAGGGARPADHSLVDVSSAGPGRGCRPGRDRPRRQHRVHAPALRRRGLRRRLAGRAPGRPSRTSRAGSWTSRSAPVTPRWRQPDRIRSWRCCSARPPPRARARGATAVAAELARARAATDAGRGHATTASVARSNSAMTSTSPGSRGAPSRSSRPRSSMRPPVMRAVRCSATSASSCARRIRHAPCPCARARSSARRARRSSHEPMRRSRSCTRRWTAGARRDHSAAAARCSPSSATRASWSLATLGHCWHELLLGHGADDESLRARPRGTRGWVPGG